MTVDALILKLYLFRFSLHFSKISSNTEFGDVDKACMIQFMAGSYMLKYMDMSILWWDNSARIPPQNIYEGGSGRKASTY